MRSWSEAWEDALYGPSGFFLRERPLDHFRTNVAVPLFAEAVRRLAGLVDLALGEPDPFDVVDLGAGRGELLGSWTDVPARWRLTSVDLAPGLPSGLPSLEGLLIANEYLDTVPLDVLADGRLVLVSESGEEQLGAPLTSAWADDWWPPDVDPSGRQGTAPRPDGSAHRVEVGASRDLAWAAAVARVRRGLAVAVDYGHTMADRRATLTGYRDGRQVHPVPDGSCDLTAHVALDSAAAATGSLLVRQREALQSLGISAVLPPTASPPAAPPPNAPPHSPPEAGGGAMRAHIGASAPAPNAPPHSPPEAGGGAMCAHIGESGATGAGDREGELPSYAVLLERASQARELLDPDGLGGFGWLVRAVGVEVGWMGT